jgi:hypothetical protein
MTLPESFIRSLDELVRSDFQSLRDSYFTWLLICTGIVVVGVVLEELGELEAIAKPWGKRLARIGWLLIIVGVIGEGVFEGFVSKADGLTQTFNDILLGDAQKEAAFAIERAANANRQAETARQETARVKARAANLEKEAGGERKTSEQLRLDAQRLEEKNLRTEAELVNLAVCNAPRVIPLWSVGNTKTSIDPLKPFAGRQAVIEFVNDAEARRAAINIAASLDRAGWKIIKASPVDGIADGVEIQAYSKSASGQKSAEEGWREWQIHIRSSEAVDALIDFLHSYNWQARMGWASPEANDIPPDGLKVRVGLYPAVTYVSPPGAKVFASAIAQFEQEREKNRKQIENQRLKREEEMLKQLSPQQAMEIKAGIEEWNKREKLWMERYSDPCQPLTPLSPSLR